MIYLDNAATTFPKPECVYTAVDYAQRNAAVNVGRGGYSVAVDSMNTVDETRLLMAELVNADSTKQVVFSPSATLAANEIILGLKWDAFKNVYISPFEHNAIARPIEAARIRYGFSVHWLPLVKETHDLDVDKMQRMFSAYPPDYVFINHISNVTGTILPVDAVCRIAKHYEALIIVDGAQSVGLIDIDLKKTKIDFLIFAGHKNLYASFGIGGFVCNSSYSLQPVLAGGTGSDSLNLIMQSATPEGFEVGSPNIIAISSLNASLKWLAETGVNHIATRKKLLMDRLVESLKSTSSVLYLPAHMGMHTSVLSFNLLDYEPTEVGMILDQDFNIAVRTGYHCAPFVHDFLGTVDSKGTVRVSLSYFNTERDIDTFVRAITSI